MVEAVTAETPIENVTLTTLLAMQDIAADRMAKAKESVALVKAELDRRFGASAKNLLIEQGKSHGIVNLACQDGIVAKADTKMTVKWDSDKLQAIAQTMPWDRVKSLFKISFSMTETIYKGVEAVAPDLRAKIDEARTTQIGEPVITLKKEG